MIGIYSAHSQIFLLVLASITTLFFALPLLLVPLAWARLMQWRIPMETDLRDGLNNSPPTQVADVREIAFYALLLLLTMLFQPTVAG